MRLASCPRLADPELAEEDPELAKVEPEVEPEDDEMEVEPLPNNRRTPLNTINAQEPIIIEPTRLFDDAPVLAGALRRGQAVCVLLEPFVALLGIAEDSVVIQRVVSGVLDPLTRRRGKADGKDMEEDETDEKEDDEEEEEEDDDDEDDEEVPLPRPLAWLAERVFDLASAKTTHERNRKQLYELQVR